MLSLRLEEIAKLVPNNSSIINVGTDHALLEIYLTKEKNVNCIGIDINPYSVKKAKENVKKNNLNIQIIETDGLNNIKLNNEIIIISGLGTKTILNILNKRTDNDLIIQSNNNIDELKKRLKKKHYYIYDEKAIYDKRWYVIIYFKKKKFFKNKKNLANINHQYINYLINIKEKELKKIPKNRYFKRIKKKINIQKLRLRIKT